MSDSTTFNNASHGFMDSFWLHALLIIPIEFGILHSTPLGPMLTGWFSELWSSAGLTAAANTATAASTGFCHLHGAELVCH